MSTHTAEPRRGRRPEHSATQREADDTATDLPELELADDANLGFDPYNSARHYIGGRNTGA